MTNSAGADDPTDPESLPIDSLAFEEAFRRLSEMAESLEDGGLTLALATARYEEGMNLVRRCNRLLDEAELKITNLRDSFSPPSSEQERDQEEDLEV